MTISKATQPSFREAYFETYVPKRGKVPLGKCVKWLVVDGKAVQCGKPCKRQRCDDCA